MGTTTNATSRTDEESDHVGAVVRDWARVVAFRPQVYVRPQSLEELKTFLSSCLQGTFQQRKVRVLGGLHSCSEICSADTIIDVSDLPHTIEFNADNSAVTVSANWHLHDFLQALSARGKSITSTGGTDHQTLAGIISTNTAGATPTHSIYETVEWIEYLAVDSDGQTIVEKRVTPADPAYLAVICSLGAIGVITRLRLGLVEERYFDTIQKIVKMKDILSDIEKTSKQYEFWRIDWIPDTNVGLLWAAQRVTSAAQEGDYPVDQSETILEALFKILNTIEPAGALLDNAMRLVYTGLTVTYGEVKANGPLRNMLPVDRRAPLRVAMAEWSFAPADLNRVLEQCKIYFEKNGWPNLPIEIELTKTDNYYMSPWNWAGLDYILKFNFMYLTDILNTQAEMAMIYTHLKGLWEHLIQVGIPFKAHWGKINFMDSAFVREHFHLEEFRPYMHPLFVNQYLSERIGD